MKIVFIAGAYFGNGDFEQIEYFYCIAVDENYNKLYYVWLLPREDFKYIKDTLYISLSKVHDYDKYIIDFTKCNLDFLNNKKKEESL